MSLHTKTVAQHAHAHDSGDVNGSNESRTLKVVLLTGITMVIEIVAGHLTGSMALLADGWHMGTHTFALGISYAAYLLARKHQDSDAFSFGTGKFGVLAGYTSALFLGVAGIWMIYESVIRIVNPVRIAFNEAILVTILGLTVNLASVFILHNSDNHGHDHDHDHHHAHDDHNYRAAYLHVIADTLTSVFALVALLSGRFLGWTFLDPVVGILGGIMIGRWAYMLLRSTGLILLDGGVGESIPEEIRERVEGDGDSCVADLHVWHVGSKGVAAIVSVVSGAERGAGEYRSRLAALPSLAHLSVEVHPCTDAECPCRKS